MQELTAQDYLWFMAVFFLAFIIGVVLVKSIKDKVAK